ncbi:MAG: hypothetical protein IPK37_18150 [Austwickia sp.]|nr:MAG: hypothetical protein IPK37_18150 [Austwickia sp.]
MRADDRDTTAAVENGRFYAEWPARPEGDGSHPTYDLTLRDGTVLRDVKPVS